MLFFFRYLLPGAAFFLAQPCLAQAGDSACAKLLRPYTAGDTGAPQKGYQFRTAGSGRLYYYGAQHLTDSLDPQFAAIRKAWQELQPTLAFYEGPDRGADSSAGATIARLGESGYLRFLARESGVRTVSLEDPAGEYKAVAAVHGNEKAALFYLLREAARLRSRTGAGQAEIEAAITALCGKMTRLLPEGVPLHNAEEVAAACRRYWPAGPEWWQLPESWLSPKSSVAEALFLPAVNRSSSEYRNRHMYLLLTEAVLKGERVFAVVGKDHIPQQEAAIRCRLGGR